jgi:hypothetical protein
MLKDVGNIIRGQLRDYDFLSRYGGDEFVAIVPDTHSADVLELCQRIETAVSEFELPVGDGNVARVGVSIGAACYPHHGETFDQIVISADKAMYLTKTFHKKRNVRLDEILNPPPIGDVEYKVPGQRVLDIDPEGLTNFAVIETSADEGLIVELDETHIVSSAAVN